MAKINTIVARESAKLSASEKQLKYAAGVMVKLLTSGDVATLNGTIAALTRWRDIATQAESQKGIRFAGAESHEFADQTQAFVERYTRGMLPAVTGNVAAPADNAGK